MHDIKRSNLCISKRLALSFLFIVVVSVVVVVSSKHLLSTKKSTDSRASTLNETEVAISDLKIAVGNVDIDSNNVLESSQNAIQTLANNAGIQCPKENWGEYIACIQGKIWGEGSAPQRLAVYGRLVLMVDFDPFNKEKSKLYISWLKFNGAEQYAKHTGLPLVSKTLKHFLFGNSETLDLTKEYQESALDPRHKFAVPPDYRNMSYMTGHLISSNLNYHTNLAGEDQSAFSIDGNVVDFVNSIRSNKPIHMKSSMVVHDGLDEEDLRNSLNQFTLYLEGDITNSTEEIVMRPEEWKQYAITMKNPTVAFYDRYDWKAGAGFGGSGTLLDLVCGVLEELGIEDPSTYLLDRLGRDGWEKLRTSTVEISDDDGTLLTKYRFGKEYDIVGSIDGGNPLEFYISAQTLKKAKTMK